jgi:hypothetical protein
MMAEDDDISRRYRELAREEPPRHLDDAIRAAARRAVHTRPAPLVVPSGRQRWYFPLAAAAIIVLAVAVTMHVEREQPGEEIVTAPAAPAPSPPEPRAEAPAEKPQSAPQPERRRKTESADSRELRDAAPPPELQKAPSATSPAPAAVPPGPPPVVAEDAVRAQESAAGAFRGNAEGARAEARAKPGGVAAPQASARLRRADEAAPSLSASALQSPEQWLQGITDLRRQGRHDEADKSLAEFRKHYPDYRISKEVLEQVEKR